MMNINMKDKFVFKIPLSVEYAMKRYNEGEKDPWIKFVGYIEHGRYIVPVITYTDDEDIIINNCCLFTHSIKYEKSDYRKDSGCILISETLYNDKYLLVKPLMYDAIAGLINSDFFSLTASRMEYVSTYLNKNDIIKGYERMWQYWDGYEYPDRSLFRIYRKRNVDKLKMYFYDDPEELEILYNLIQNHKQSDVDIITYELSENNNFQHIQHAGTVKYDMWEIPLYINDTLPVKNINNEKFLDARHMISISALMKHNTNHIGIVIGRAAWDILDHEMVIKPLLYHEIAHIIDPNFFNETLADQFAVSHIGAKVFENALREYKNFVSAFIKEVNKDTTIEGFGSVVQDIEYRVDSFYRYDNRIGKRIKICEI